MSWTLSINPEKDSAGERTVTGTWTDLNFGTFSFSLSIKTNAVGFNEFTSAAIKARDKWQNNMTTVKEKETSCLAALNAADSKAVT